MAEKVKIDRMVKMGGNLTYDCEYQTDEDGFIIEDSPFVLEPYYTPHFYKRSKGPKLLYDVVNGQFHSNYQKRTGNASLSLRVNHG